MPNGDMAVPDQVYFSSSDGVYRVIHKGHVLNVAFTHEKAAHEHLAELRARALVEEACNDNS